MSTQPISPPALPFVVEPLGLLPYADAWARQRELAAQRAVDLVGDTLLVVEHPHVYTLGSKGKRAHLLVTEAALQAQGIPVLDVDRGGDITYHGPGQLVAYPILRLKDWNVKIVDYLRLLEAVLIEVCLGYGLVAQRIQGYTGVWIGDAKVAAIGAKLDGNGITRHGCALNVAPDLSYFQNIVPCGIRDKAVTSLSHEVAQSITLDDASIRFVAAFTRVFMHARNIQPGIA